MNGKINVCIAEDHTMVRKAMIMLFQSFGRMGNIREAANGKQLIEQIRESQPDVVTLDLEMPVMNGYDTARHILYNYPSIKILVLSMHAEKVLVSKMLQIGVHGFLTKDAAPAEIERALYSLVDKDFYRNEVMTGVTKELNTRTSEIARKLSPRELEILLLICQEHSPTEISERLKISDKTFFNHRSNLLCKTGALNNVGLVKYAFENKIIRN
jgi:DNA-binding NarL/FixJ family response regulator